MFDSQQVSFASPTRGWIGESWKCYWPIVLRLLPIFLIVCIPCEILSECYSSFVLGGAEDARALSKSIRFAHFLEGTVGLFAYIPLILATRDMREGRLGHWGGYFKQVFRLWGRVFGVNLLTALLLLVLALLLLFPALIGFVYVAFACEAAILLNLSGSAAIRESYHVIKGHWWATVGYFIVAALIGVGLYLPPVAIFGVFGGIVETVTEDVEELLGIGRMIVFVLDVVSSWFGDVALAFVYVSGTIWFLRLKAARDGRC